MAKEEQKEKKSCGNNNWHPGNGAVYGLGFIGSAIYFVQHADSFGAGVWGVLQAIVWPAFLVYKAFELLKF